MIFVPSFHYLYIICVIHLLNPLFKNTLLVAAVLKLTVNMPTIQTICAILASNTAQT